MGSVSIINWENIFADVFFGVKRKRKTPNSSVSIYRHLLKLNAFPIVDTFKFLSKNICTNNKLEIVDFIQNNDKPPLISEHYIYYRCVPIFNGL